MRNDFLKKFVDQGRLDLPVYYRFRGGLLYKGYICEYVSRCANHGIDVAKYDFADIVGFPLCIRNRIHIRNGNRHCLFVKGQLRV